jgi:predicted metal-binding protein
MVNVIRFYTCADCNQRYAMKVGQHFKMFKTNEAALVCDDCFFENSSWKEYERFADNQSTINVLLQTLSVPVEKPKKSKKRAKQHGKNSKTK